MTEDQKQEYDKLCKDAGETQYAIKLAEAMLTSINQKIFEMVGDKPIQGDDPTKPQIFRPGGPS